MSTTSAPEVVDGKKPAPNPSRDPYIIHLNIALSMVVSLYFGGKSHVSNGQNVSSKEPCPARFVVSKPGEPWEA